MMMTNHGTLQERIQSRRGLYLDRRKQKKILLIGNIRDTDAIAKNLQKSTDHYMVVGCLRTNSREPVPSLPVKPNLHIFGDLTEMEIFLAIIPIKVHIILVADPEIRHHQTLRILELARRYEAELWAIPQLANAFIGDLKFFNFFGHPVIRIEGSTIPRVKTLFKTVFDYTAAALGLFVLSPLILLTALLIKATSRGPVFFTQERVGRNGNLFRVFKFRSMELDALGDDQLLEGLENRRVTALGKLLRRTHIDEIPQLLNVLRGEMSIVGPRPERPFFVKAYQRYIPFYRDRFTIKPGITGIAQVYGAYHSKPEEKLIFDLNYIHNFNLGSDLVICLRTVWVVLRSLFVTGRRSEI